MTDVKECLEAIVKDCLNLNLWFSQKIWKKKWFSISMFGSIQFGFWFPSNSINKLNELNLL